MQENCSELDIMLHYDDINLHVFFKRLCSAFKYYIKFETYKITVFYCDRRY